MDRRDFLKVGAAAGAAAAGTGCVGDFTSPPATPAIATYSPEQMDAFLRKLDEGVGVVNQHATLPRMLPRGVVNRFDPNDFGDAKNDELLRKVLRSLVVSSSFRSLELEDQAHPGVQSRVWGSMGEMDSAVRETNALLEQLTPTERDDLRQAMRDDPELPRRFIETLDEHAARANIPMATRLQLRTAGLHACARVKQSPSLVIDEYTEKCKKTLERSGSNEEVLRRTTARLGDEAAWAVQERLLAAHARWKVALGQPTTDGAPGQPAPPQPYQPQPGEAQPWPNDAQAIRVQGALPPPVDNGAEGLVTAGAVMLGISGALTGLGVGLLFAVTIAGAIVLTVAGVLLLIGLIVLIVGLARR